MSSRDRSHSYEGAVAPLHLLALFPGHIYWRMTLLSKTRTCMSKTLIYIISHQEIRVYLISQHGLAKLIQMSRKDYLVRNDIKIQSDVINKVHSQIRILMDSCSKLIKSKCLSSSWKLVSGFK